MVTVLFNVVAMAACVFCAWKTIQFILKPFFSPLADLPGPTSWNPLLGNLTGLMGGRLVEVHKKWLEEYGPTLKFKALFNTYRLFTVDTKAINHILTHSMDYQKPELSRISLSHVLGEGILVAEGEKHKQQRRILNPSFGPASIRALTPIMLEKAIRLRDIWLAELVKDDGPQRIDVLTWFSRIALDIIGEAGFNYKFKSLDNESMDELNQAFATLFRADQSHSLLAVLQILFPVLRFIRTKRNRIENKAKADMLRIGGQLVKERQREVLEGKKDDLASLDHADGGRDLLSTLIRANLDSDIPDSQRMSDEDVLAQVPTFFVAGHETSSTQMAWTLLALSQNIRVQDKLRKELLKVTTDTPSMDELADLPYLDAVIRESMRLNAAIPASLRVATKDDVIPLGKPFINKHGQEQHSVKVLKGETIVIPIIFLHHLKEMWGDNVEEFYPERWENPPEDLKSMPGVWGNLMGFLGGARSCIGYRFALVEMKTVLFTLIRSFEFHPAVRAEDVQARTLVVTRPYLKSEMDRGAQLPLMIKRCATGV